jgi:putative flippase GtrA
MMRDRPLDLSLLRFLIVGGGFSALYATLAALATSYVPLPKALSSVIVWIVCIPIVFWCHRRFTFPTRQPHRLGLWVYAATQVMGLAIVATASGLLARGVFWPDLIVHFLATGVAAVVSYLITRSVIFLPQSAE